MCINRVKNRHLGPGLIVIGNFLFFVVESLMERKLNLKRGYQIKTNHWLAMLSVPVLSIAVCISIMNPEEHRIRESPGCDVIVSFVYQYSDFLSV